MTQTLNQPDLDKDIYFQQEGFIPDEACVFHGFFSRRGGVSDGVYASLNCGAGSDDVPEHVVKNRAIVADAAGCDADKLLSLYQVHSADCLIIREPWSGDKPKADAFVTDVVGTGLGVLTADCGPVLFYGEKDDGSSVIGAAHAGWGGAVKGVLEATLDKMQEIGAELSSIRATVGPCIGPQSYEVREDFAVPFLEDDEAAEKFFKSARRDGHLMFDLPGYCAFRLARAGVKHVSLMDMDTYAREDDFFSYRRKTHRDESDYGRQISVIAIQK